MRKEMDRGYALGHPIRRGGEAYRALDAADGRVTEPGFEQAPGNRMLQVLGGHRVEHACT